MIKEMRIPEEPTLKDELIGLVRLKVKEFVQFLSSNPADNFMLKIVKFILKIPVALFVVLASPVLLLILGVVFVILL